MTNFWESSVWYALIQFFILAFALCIGNILRRKVPFLKKFVLPTAVIGGIILLVIKSVFPWLDNLIDENFMSSLTYHCLALGFIAMTLKKIEEKGKNKGPVIVNTGITTVCGYLIQGIVGLVITIPLYFVMKEYLIPAAGVLLPMGFGQGTGQALSFGTIFENTYGFKGGASFGLSIATIGFLIACVVGVIYLNILKKKGKIAERIDNESSTKMQVVAEENEIPLSESIDKLTVQFILILTTYGFTYLFMYGFNCLIEAGLFGNFGPNTLQPLIWGFNFLFGTLFALLIRTIISFLHKKNVMTKIHQNNYMLNRLSGFFFDVMIASGVAAIEITHLKHLWLPLLLLTIGGTITTLVYLNLVKNYLWKGYENEGMVSMFGMLTGTASTGIILLREIDPNFETPAADNLVYQSIFAMVFGFPIMLLVSYAPQSLNASIITLCACVLLFVVYNIIIFRNVIFKKRRGVK